GVSPAGSSLPPSGGGERGAGGRTGGRLGAAVAAAVVLLDREAADALRAASPIAGHMRRFQIPGRHVAALAALLVAVVAAGGCRTPQAPLLADPSWPVRHGQAVWQASAGAEEVAGELVFAGYPGSDGYVVEFSKPAVTLFRVVRNADAWELGVPGEGAH